MTDPFVGSLTFFRVYSGTLNSGDQVYNPVKSKKERVGRILQMHANNRDEIKEVRAGDIAAAVGLKDVTTGDTLCAQDHVITLERMIFPEPVISMAVEPKTKSDQEKMGLALGRLAQEDPSFRVRTDEESGQTIISGMGELHLEILVDRMKREFNVEANVGKPQVAYRETIRKAVKSEGKFVRQSGGKGQFGHVWLEISPNEQGKGYEFENGIVGGVIPKEYIPAVDKGIQEAVANGLMAGFPIVDVKVKLVDGSYHDVDSSEMAFKIAGSMGFKEGFHKASPGAARADDEGRDRHARGLPRRRDGRRQPPPRHPAGPGRQPVGQDHQRDDPAGRNVRLRDLAAFDVAGPRDLHDGIRPLRRSAEQHRRSRDQEVLIVQHRQHTIKHFEVSNHGQG